MPTPLLFSALAAPSSVPPADELRHLPIICLTSKASPDDLRSYMAAGMDGCISKPAEPGPLLNTLRAAVPRHLSRPSSIDGGPLTNGAGPGRGGGGMKVMQGKGMGVLKGSAACAAEGMALAPRHEGSVEGNLQVLFSLAAGRTSCSQNRVTPQGRWGLSNLATPSPAAATAIAAFISPHLHRNPGVLHPGIVRSMVGILNNHGMHGGAHCPTITIAVPTVLVKG